MKLSHYHLTFLALVSALGCTSGKKFRYIKSKYLNKQYKDSLVDVFTFLGRFEATQLELDIEDEGKLHIYSFILIPIEYQYSDCQYINVWKGFYVINKINCVNSKYIPVSNSKALKDRVIENI